MLRLLTSSLVCALVPAVVLLASPVSVQAGLFGTESYEDCVLDSMKGVTSDVAAREIRKACRTKFPEDKSLPAGYTSTKRTSFNEALLSKLEGKGVFRTSPVNQTKPKGETKLIGYYVEVYNGNDDCAVESMDFELTWTEGDKEFTRRFRAPVKTPNAANMIMPLSTETLRIDHTFGLANQVRMKSWNIVSASGYC